jgi:hypothetical protein
MDWFAAELRGIENDAVSRISQANKNMEIYLKSTILANPKWPCDSETSLLQSVCLLKRF